MCINQLAGSIEVFCDLRKIMGLIVLETLDALGTQSNSLVSSLFFNRESLEVGPKYSSSYLGTVQPPLSCHTSSVFL